MKRLLSLLLACSSCEAKSIVDGELLNRVAIIESNLNPSAIGDNGEGRGAFQLHHAAWLDGVAWLRTHGLYLTVCDDYRVGSMEFETSKMVASGYLKMHEARLNRIGECVTPLKLYMLYRFGWSGARKYDFNPNHSDLRGLDCAVLTRARIILSK